MRSLSSIVFACFFLVFACSSPARGQEGEQPAESPLAGGESLETDMDVNEDLAGGTEAEPGRMEDELDKISGPLTLASLGNYLKNHEGYTGGRGLITTQGMSGMFQNPTSGTLKQGQLTAQYCALFFPSDSAANVGQAVMASYGITDYLEAGLTFNWVRVSIPNADNKYANVIGPFARLRLLKDEGLIIPELSIGGIWLDGDAFDDILAKGEAFLAASKQVVIDRDGLIKSARLHLGVRAQANGEKPDGADRNRTFGFIGGEVELPFDIWLVGEVNDKKLTQYVPYSLGAQWRPTHVVGVSVAAVQTGDLSRLSLYVGIGLIVGFGGGDE